MDEKKGVRRGVYVCSGDYMLALDGDIGIFGVRVLTTDWRLCRSRICTRANPRYSTRGQLPHVSEAVTEVALNRI
jgi:hypothetical protein